MWDFFLKLFAWIPNAIIWCLKTFFSWLLKLILDNIPTGVIDYITSVIPDLSQLSSTLNFISPYIGFVNSWVDLRSAGVCLTSYVTFIIIMIGVKLLFKLCIPTLG